MEYFLTEEQNMARDMARKFADKELKPLAEKLDREHTHSPEILKAFGEMGIMGVAVPTEYGGGGMDYVSYAMIVSEISRACGGTGTIVAAHNSLYCYPLMKFGSEEQKQKFLTPCASGESVGCYALTEADAGSDPASMRTTARLDGDHWVINGEKKFITNGNIADFCVFAASTDKSKGYKGITQFVCDVRETPGFKVGRVEEKLGINASGTAELIFEDARIPKENILGEPGSGLKQMLETLDSGRISIASQALGIGKAVLEESLEYRETPHPVWKTNLGIPGDPVEAGRYGHSSGSRRAAYLASGLAGRPWYALRERSGNGENVHLGHCYAGCDRGSANPGWIRLLQGIPHGKTPQGCQDHSNLRRHQ